MVGQEMSSRVTSCASCRQSGCKAFGQACSSFLPAFKQFMLWTRQHGRAAWCQSRGRLKGRQLKHASLVDPILQQRLGAGQHLPIVQKAVGVCRQSMVILQLSLDCLGGVTSCDGQLEVVVLGVVPAQLGGSLDDQMHHWLPGWSATWVHRVRQNADILAVNKLTAQDQAAQQQGKVRPAFWTPKGCSSSRRTQALAARHALQDFEQKLVWG